MAECESVICECGHGVGVHAPGCPCGCEAFVAESDGFAEAYWREQARIRGEIVSHLKVERDRYRDALRRAHGYITDLGDDGNEGAALLARRIAEDLSDD